MSEPTSESSLETTLETTPIVNSSESPMAGSSAAVSPTGQLESINPESINPESKTTLPQALPTPLNSLTGALIAGIFAMGLSKLTQTIATGFATRPITSTNPLALSISAAVRTLVVGASTLVTGIFTIAAFSLVLLAIQVAFQSQQKKSHPLE